MPTLNNKHKLPRPGGEHMDARQAMARRIRSSGRWQKVRDRYAKRNPLCEMCGKPTQEIHHRQPVERRPELAFVVANLQALCRPCHEIAEKAVTGPQERR